MTHGVIQVAIFGFVNHGVMEHMAMLPSGMLLLVNHLEHLVIQTQIITSQLHSQVNQQPIRIVTIPVKKKSTVNGNTGKMVNQLRTLMNGFLIKRRKYTMATMVTWYMVNKRLTANGNTLIQQLALKLKIRMFGYQIKRKKFTTMDKEIWSMVGKRSMVINNTLIQQQAHNTRTPMLQLMEKNGTSMVLGTLRR